MFEGKANAGVVEGDARRFVISCGPVGAVHTVVQASSRLDRRSWWRG